MSIQRNLVDAVHACRRAIADLPVEANGHVAVAFEEVVNALRPYLEVTGKVQRAVIALDEVRGMLGEVVE